MPIISLWTLVISSWLLALGVTYKNADIRRSRKCCEDELAATRSKISTLDEKYNKQIQDIQMQYEARIKELTEEITKLKTKRSSDWDRPIPNEPVV